MQRPLFALLALALAPSVLRAQTPPRPDTNGLPFVRLFTVVSSSASARAMNNLPTADRERRLDQLVRWYGLFHGDSATEFPLGEPSKGPLSPTTSLAERLVQRGAVATGFRAGAGVARAARGMASFGEAADLETRAPLAISTWWPGQRFPGAEPTNSAARLAAAVDQNSTGLLVSSVARVRPPGAPEAWPYLPSRGRGALPGSMKSDSTADLVSWVRLDDEICRVRTVTPQATGFVLSVDRGYFGTTKAAHTNGTRVFSPVYIGSSAALVGERNGAGSPPINSPQFPLRYGVKFWQDSAAGPLKDGLGWLAGRLAASFGLGRPAPYLQGHNGVWLDSSTCAPHNFADAYGQPVTPWDDAMGAAATPETWGAHQVAKARALRARLGAMGYTNFQFYLDNVAAASPVDADCRTRLLGASGVDGGVLEHWLQDVAQWELAMNQHLVIQAQNLPALYWLQWNELAAAMTLEHYQRWAYASYLLAWNPAATRPRLGGPFGLGAPMTLVFWNLGQPASQPGRLADLQTQVARRLTGGQVKVFRREFSGGLVIVNITRESVRCELGADYFDVFTKSPQGQPALVRTVELAPMDADILIKASPSR